MIILNKGITAPKGFKAAGIACGIKAKKKDLSLIVSDVPCHTAAAFTTNKVKAAPVQYNEALYEKEQKIRCILTNSGNANACTGEQGKTDAYAMAQKTAESLGLSAEEIMINSTGVIGVPLPMEKVLLGINEITKQIGDDEISAANAAEGIMTTDTFAKTVCVEVIIDTKPVRIAAIAKGSGMIHPNMATMLSFITTDVNIDAALFRSLMSETVKDSYNMLSVDGDTSTNDTVIALANGLAGNEMLQLESAEFPIFEKAFQFVNQHVAKLIAKDGEGATKFLNVKVYEAKTKEDARALALSVIKSSLVKTAFFGEDANWGRVLCAMGYAGADFDPDKVVLTFESEKGSITLYEKGVPIAFDEAKALEILKEKEIVIHIRLGEGPYSAESFGCDLSYEYVKINGEYRS